MSNKMKSTLLGMFFVSLMSVVLIIFYVYSGGVQAGPPRDSPTYRFKISHYYFGNEAGTSSAYKEVFFTDSIGEWNGFVMFRPDNGNRLLRLYGSIRIDEDMRVGHGFKSSK